MSGKNSQVEMTGCEIAVIGLSCRFPGADTIARFWDNLAQGKESITFFSEEELIAAGVSPEVVKDPDYVKAMGILDDDVYQCFDHHFFDYTPREAEMMDPQMRVFHECTFEALEDAGYNPETFKGAIGMFACGSPNLNWELLVATREANDMSRLFEADKLYDKDYLPTRISYKLNLTGPSIFLYTACSSSLTAIHIACQSLLSGECDMAAAGGVSILYPHKTGYPYKKGMISSPDGHCRAFDEKAEGTVRGNGAGVVVLKLMENAVRDGDHIYAFIRGSACNNDGKGKVGYAAPAIQGQTNVIKAALATAGITPESVSCIEAHGTGTKIGDPIEIEALTKAFHTGKKQYCKIGSVKTNIGHLDTAAGVAGFIKTILMLKHKKIVPSLHFTKANPAINFAESPFSVSTMLEDWEPGNGPRIAGISSFGIGGTNVHCIVQEAPGNVTGKTKEQDPEVKPYTIMTVSARTITAFSRQMENYRNLFKETGHDPADIAFTLQTGRKSFEYRKAFMVKTKDELRETITAGSFCAESMKKSVPGRPIFFLFSGNVSADTFRIMNALTEIPCIKDEYDSCMNALYSCNNDKTKTSGPVSKDTIPHKAGFVFEYVLARVFIKLGITPYALYGSGAGEVTAACISGILPLHDALESVPDGNVWPDTGSTALRFEPSAKPGFPIILGRTAKLAGFLPADTVRHHGPDMIMESDNAVLLEMGHFHSIIPGLKQALHDKQDTVIINPIPDTCSFYRALARLWEAGIEINFELLYRDGQPRRVPLPTYPFDRNRFWTLAGHPDRLIMIKPGSDKTNKTREMDYKEERDDIEKRIKTLWQDILGYEHIGSDDDFFASGGDSIKAITLLSDIEKYFSINFPLHDLFENPTVKKITAYIINNKRGNIDDPYVVYNRKQTKTVFCFPPYICMGLAYYELFTCMKDYTAYCFNYYKKEAIISFYAEHIMHVAGKSPSIIFAYSAGARVAYAVARLLEEKGYPASGMVILDGFVRWKTTEVFVEEKETARAKELLINYDRYTGVFNGNESYMNKLLERIIHYSKLTCEIQIKEKIDADIHFIKAEPMERTEDNEDWYEYTINNNWEAVTRNRYKEYQGAGRHLDMFYPEYLDTNAQIIRLVFDDMYRQL
ncbi:MAG: hypothetical protein JXB88_24605 [Spirochaetales bacterium]|nr:hypothetical protein [Spirochaetales bacterium]